EDPQPMIVATICSASAITRHPDLGEQAVEIGGCLACQLVERHATDLGELLCGMPHVARLVRLAAMWHRRKIRRVGLDEVAVGRHCSRDLLNFGSILEG